METFQKLETRDSFQKPTRKLWNINLVSNDNCGPMPFGITPHELQLVIAITKCNFGILPESSFQEKLYFLNRPKVCE